MSDLGNVKGRLLEFIKYKGMSARSFSLSCGFSANYVTNISKGISAENLNSISVCYPELNTGWLVTGEGTMLRTLTYETKEEADAAANPSSASEFKRKYDEAMANLEKTRELLEKEQELSKAKDVTISTLQKMLEMLNSAHDNVKE